jgi:FkbM family methyltransferase
MSHAFHSEHGQDKWLDEHVFHGMRDGVFVEVGALDGLNGSNTLYFEEAFGWTGVLIEANPHSALDCVKNRPKCETVFAAALDISGEYLDLMALEGGFFGWSGIAEAMHPTHLSRIIEQTVESQRKVMPVLTRRLDDILRERGMTRIDYMSIDVEGAEHKALIGLGDMVRGIHIVDIENNWEDDVASAAWLEKHRFRKICRLGVNDIWINDEWR